MWSVFAAAVCMTWHRRWMLFPPWKINISMAEFYEVFLDSPIYRFCRRLHGRRALMGFNMCINCVMCMCSSSICAQTINSLRENYFSKFISIIKWLSSSAHWTGQTNEMREKNVTIKCHGESLLRMQKPESSSFIIANAMLLGLALLHVNAWAFLSSHYHCSTFSTLMLSLTTPTQWRTWK